MQTFILRKGDANRPNVLANAQRFLEMLPDDKSWEVTVKRHAKQRSNPQCRYLNGVAYKLLSDATGYERDDVAEYLLGLYFGTKEKRMPGNRTEQVPIRTTTTDADGNRSVLTTTEFMDYVAYIQRFAAGKGLYIPDPNEGE